ncbi:phage tail tip lysozyme [Streptomyces sp. NRRL F-5123]|uniref:phage tail tip lysozyme n=1 Tax=Streptomyces sp. NRRL F-5123 TaxID=1463856 RepID=UPI00131BE675|nr:phage tail tip lysozyme [Streptomyces sp. NRRL F-5123]
MNGKSPNIEAGPPPADADFPGHGPGNAPAAVAVVPSAGDWTKVGNDDRMLYCMRQLVDRYGYPPAGAAGIVGNLWAESAVLPNRIEGSSPSTPMRAKNFAGVTTNFTAVQIMDRKPPDQGPKLPGVGLAQWTSPSRRSGLFRHVYNGVALGTDVLSNMDAQLDYFDRELRTSYSGVRQVLSGQAVSVEAASDEVVYNYEIPGAILSGHSKLPRTDARVQTVFKQRRSPSNRALTAYQSGGGPAAFEPFPGASFFHTGQKSPIIAAMHQRLVAEDCNRYQSSADADVWGPGDVKSYAAWQQKLGLAGDDANGIPGKTSWDELQVPNV